MTMQTTHFDDKVTIKCLKNGNMIEAEVLSFRENEFLTAVVQKRGARSFAHHQHHQQEQQEQQQGAAVADVIIVM